MREDVSWLKDLKPGDEVAIDNSGIWHRNYYVISKVTKITPTGRIKLENGRQFFKNGMEIGGSSYFSPLRQITPEIREFIKRRELLGKLKFEKFAGLLSSERLEILLQWQEELLMESEGLG